MSALFSLTPVTEADEPFLFEVYASTRAAEMSLVPWSDEEKQYFLQTQFKAQTDYYREHYPNASFELIKIDGKPAGRFYLVELAAKIIIIDLVFLPAHFDQNIFIKLVGTVLEKGATSGKPVQIYLENDNPAVGVFTDLGFQNIGEHGFYFLWEKTPAARSHTKTSAIKA